MQRILVECRKPLRLHCTSDGIDYKKKYEALDDRPAALVADRGSAVISRRRFG